MFACQYQKSFFYFFSIAYNNRAYVHCLFAGASLSPNDKVNAGVNAASTCNKAGERVLGGL